MKPRVLILVCAAILLVVPAAFWVKRSQKAGPTRPVCSPLLSTPNAQPVAGNPDAPTKQTPTSVAPQTVIAYYFHGTVRCETCLLIEALARAVVEQQFAGEIAANRLTWQSVNYDLPENRHFLTDFNLPCPSLVLVAQQKDKPPRWKLLGDTWQLVHEPSKLNDYVATEVRNFLTESGQPTGKGAGSTNPPSQH